MQAPIQLPPQFLQIINQVFDLEKKISKVKEPHTMLRNLERIRGSFQEIGLEVECGFDKMDYDLPSSVQHPSINFTKITFSLKTKSHPEMADFFCALMQSTQFATEKN